MFLPHPKVENCSAWCVERGWTDDGNQPFNNSTHLHWSSEWGTFNPSNWRRKSALSCPKEWIEYWRFFPPLALPEIPLSSDLESNIIISGACGGTCACSTCHIIVESQDVFHKLPDPEDRECDMLDMAFGLTETSRLACQLKASNTFKGTKLRVPPYGNFTPSSMKQ